MINRKYKVGDLVLKEFFGANSINYVRKLILITEIKGNNIKYKSLNPGVGEICQWFCTGSYYYNDSVVVSKNCKLARLFYL
jgi:hypothetical protein